MVSDGHPAFGLQFCNGGELVYHPPSPTLTHLEPIFSLRCPLKKRLKCPRLHSAPNHAIAHPLSLRSVRCLVRPRVRSVERLKLHELLTFIIELVGIFELFSVVQT